MARRRAASARRNPPSGGATPPTRSAPNRATAFGWRSAVVVVVLAFLAKFCIDGRRRYRAARDAARERSDSERMRSELKSHESSSTPARTRTWLGMTAPPCSIPAARATSRSLLARVRITLKTHKTKRRPQAAAPATPHPGTRIDTRAAGSRARVRRPARRRRRARSPRARFDSGPRRARRPRTRRGRSAR